MKEAKRTQQALREELEALRARAAELERQLNGRPAAADPSRAKGRPSRSPACRTAGLSSAPNGQPVCESLHHIIVETMNEGLVIEDIRGNITYVNLKFCELLGRAREHIMGRSPMDFIQPADIPLFQEQTAHRRQVPQSRYELKLRAPDDRGIPVIVSAQALYDNEKNFLGTFAVVTDITELKQAQDAVRMFTAMVEQSSDSYVYTDTDYCIRYLNPAAERMYGWKLEDIWGKTPDIFNVDPRRADPPEGNPGQGRFPGRGLARPARRQRLSGPHAQFAAARR